MTVGETYDSTNTRYCTFTKLQTECIERARSHQSNQSSRRSMNTRILFIAAKIKGNC